MIVAGFGCRAGASPASLEAALILAADGRIPDMLATAEDRVGLVAPVARKLGLRLLGIAPDALSAIATPTRSAASLATRNVGSVAEAAALAAAGPGARLLTPRRIAPDRSATCAIAQGPDR